MERTQIYLDKDQKEALSRLSQAKGVPMAELVRNGRSHGLEVPDAIIAAAAKTQGAVLATVNVKHFPMKDLAVIQPY